MVFFDCSNLNSFVCFELMRFNLLSLLLLVTVVALAIALSLKRTPDKLILIGGHIDTWELQDSAGMESQWLDRSQPPKLSVSDAFQISQSICSHLKAKQEKTGVGFWETVTVSLERLDEQRWAYFVRIEGTDYPAHLGQSLVEQITCMILLDRSVVFDSGSCPNKLCDAIGTFPNIIDGAPTVNERPAKVGGVF